jgi:hypothetical protein
MDTLSPTARRFIALALTQQGDERQIEQWHAWTLSGTSAVPAHLAQIARRALAGMSRAIEQQLEFASTSSTAAAQMENDLGYIADIEAYLAETLQRPVAACGQGDIALTKSPQAKAPV